MSVIYYDLGNVRTLSQFVSAWQNGAWTAAVNHMPQQAGIYVIANFNTDNVYVGIAANLNHRFAPRHEAAVHLGINQAYMREIMVWYGSVRVYHTPNPLAGLPGPGAPAPQLVLNGGAPGNVPLGQIGALSVIANGLPYTANIDNANGVSLERLLIRFYMSQGIFNTNTNTQLVNAAWFNNTGNTANIYINYAAVGTIPAGYRHAQVLQNQWL